jgi:hypothetical protein
LFASSSSEIIGKELQAIKEAVLEIKYGDSAKSCTCESKGCPLCIPAMTFIVAQSQHDIQIVPEDGSRDKNVPSGTCVDIALLGLSSLSLDDSEQSSAGEFLKNVEVKAREEGRVFDPFNKLEDSTSSFQLIPHK